MKIEILAIGRLKKGAAFDMAAEYSKRIMWPLSVIELEAPSSSGEQKKLLEAIKPEAVVIALDEKGQSLPSREIAAKIEHWQDTGAPLLQFVIGGADGLNDDLRARADFLLSFGTQTWPHILARVMLLEQIYRCQQILKNHPYHRD